MRLVPLSVLHVEYIEGDHWGHLFALFSEVPIFIMVAYATLICSRRDLTTISMVCGQLLNEVLNFCLKRWFQHARPRGASLVAPEFGMPSNHAQFMGYFTMCLSLWCLRCWGVDKVWRMWTVCALISCAGVVCSSRIYLNYHDVPQVFVGLIVGSLAGAGWFLFLQSCIRRVFPWIASLPFARTCLIRDLTDVPNVLQAEYLAHSKRRF